jgi:hypothetical protein
MLNKILGVLGVVVAGLIIGSLLGWLIATTQVRPTVEHTMPVQSTLRVRTCEGCDQRINHNPQVTVFGGYLQGDYSDGSY